MIHSHTLPGEGRAFTFIIPGNLLQFTAIFRSIRASALTPEVKTTERKSNESNENSRPEPHRVPGPSQMVCADDRGRPGQKPVNDQERAARAPPRQRQGLRMLEQALCALRRVSAQDVLGSRGSSAEELARMLRVVPGLPRGILRPPRQATVRMQRVRTGAQLPDEEEVLHRLRRTGRLRGDAQALAHRHPPVREGHRGDGQYPLPVRPEGPVRLRDPERTRRHVQGLRAQHGLRMDRGRSLQREGA